MKINGRAMLRRAVGFVCAVSAALAMLALIIDAVGTSAPLMLSLMTRRAPAEATGLDAAAYDECAVMIAGYLGGSVETFQLTASVNGGEPSEVFNSGEQAHMADCLTLFCLCRTVAMTALLVCLVCAAALFFLRRPDHRGVQGFRAGLYMVLALVAALLIWGLIDFDSLFVLFHRLSFTNDLWLMNPATDMIIRLMPITFFTDYALIIGGTWVGMLCLADMVIGFATRKKRKRT